MKIGILGSGFIVDVFVKNSKMIKDFELYAIWGRHEEKIKQFKGFKLYTTDINEFLNDKNIEVVYIALPNALHYEYALKALKSDKHVMLEKPFCTNYSQAKSLVDYAKKHKLLLYETIMTTHSKMYQKMKKNIESLGEIKMIDISFCQYSRRYEKFKNSIITPAFDYKMAGGTLMDLGVYNIYFVLDMFGIPKNTHYFPNIYKKVDTSGVLILDYGKFKANMVAGKDQKSPCYAQIQGDKGYLRCNSTTSRCSNFEVVLNDGKRKIYEGEDSEFVGWLPMYKDFVKIYKNKDYETCNKLLKQTLNVQKVLDAARVSAKMEY